LITITLKLHVSSFLDNEYISFKYLNFVLITDAVRNRNRASSHLLPALACSAASLSASAASLPFAIAWFDGCHNQLVLRLFQRNGGQGCRARVMGQPLAVDGESVRAGLSVRLGKDEPKLPRQLVEVQVVKQVIVDMTSGAEAKHLCQQL
jgi:hypothetical protein